MTTGDVRTKYLNFFKKQGHKIIASASLLPENDPTTLFVGSGMQPLIPYLLGEPHPEGARVVDSQKCFRAEDIDEVGDNRHTTFFEMLGNWSFGDYFKEEQLAWFFEFLVDELKIDPAHLYVTVFAGDKEKNIPRDTESAEIWKKLFLAKGIAADDVELLSEKIGGEVGMQGGRIFYYDSEKNWWSRAGVPDNMPDGEPGGPDSEIFYEFTDVNHDQSYGKYCHPNCDCGRFMEIGNSVFMEYKKLADGTFEQLAQKNVDFGGGLERITSAANNYADMFQIDTLNILVDAIEKSSGVLYAKASERQKKSFRVIADHLRGSIFLMADGAEPSNKEQGYMTRRLLRRSIRHMDILGMPENTLYALVASVVSLYAEIYPVLGRLKTNIEDSIKIEEEKFRKTLTRGLREFEKLIKESPEQVSGANAFMLFSTYGFPIEITKELAAERNIMLDEKAYKKEFAAHQETSRAGITQKFQGGLADHSEETTRGHTATHLLQAALRKVLGGHVFQKGSNITPERIRFDFSHTGKMAPEQIMKVEREVNEAIKSDYPVTREEMTLADARAAGALGVFKDRYGEKVKVYKINGYSIEVCGGPHVERTSQIGKFKINKEEAVGRGVRRIKAVLGNVNDDNTTKEK